MRKTKIVCTLGPATNDVEIMKQLIQNGMDAARINFSHGTYETHAETIAKLKQAREELNAPIPLILDTKGPEIRVKTFKEDKVRLEEDATFTLTTREVEGDMNIVSVTYADLPKDVHRGSRILIDDGLIELKVEDITETDVVCKVVNGGVVKSRKGVNLPGVEVNLPSLMEKDIEDLKFGVENGFDIVAASFIRSAEDVLKIRRVLEENGGQMHIISKIENQQGVENIDKILEASDGIMVARGDLGVEIPPEEVPLVQKILIAKANRIGKPVITATQMLESMVHSPRPTRAEANDVANAIFDGSDAIMLSGETAAGAYPLEAVATMARIALKAESAVDYAAKLANTTEPARVNITNAISMAACATAAELKTAAITTVTKSGFTARMISRYRPACPLIASTSDETVWRQMNLIWGCKPMLYTGELPRGGVFDTALEIAVKSGLLKNGDTVVSALGMPLGFSGATNTLRVDIVGDVLCKGKGVGTKRATGTARVITARDGVERTFHQGDILVTTATDSSFMPYIRKAAAIVVGPLDQNANSHAEVAGMALDIPVIVCNAKVVDFIPAHSLITVDAEKGFVYKGIPKEE